MLRSRMANDHSALTDELKLGEDNSDPIKVHPELNSVSSLRPRFFQKLRSQARECTLYHHQGDLID